MTPEDAHPLPQDDDPLFNWVVESSPLPHWAIARSNGDCMVPGSQLPTRDGRKLGNATVLEVSEGPIVGLEKLATIVTDAGTIVRMTKAELEERFYPPIYLCDVDEAKRKFLPEGEQQ